MASRKKMLPWEHESEGKCPCFFFFSFSVKDAAAEVKKKFVCKALSVERNNTTFLDNGALGTAAKGKREASSSFPRRERERVQ